MSKQRKRGHNEGSLQQRGDTFRLRYLNAKGERVSITFNPVASADGSPRDQAKAKLADLLQTVRKGEHIAPSRDTVGAWFAQCGIAA